MPEQEELTLVVTLDDRASAQLGNLRAQLTSMAQGVSNAGAGMQSSTHKTAQSVAQLNSGLLSLVAKGSFIGNFFGGVAKEVANLGLQIVQRATDMEGLTREMLEMSHAAHTLGTNTAQLRENFQMFARAGVPMEQAQKALQGIADTFVDLQMMNSQTVPKLMQANILPIQQMRAQVLEMKRAANPDELADVVRRGVHAVREYNTAKYGAAVGASEEQRYLAILKAQGIEFTENARKVSDWQKQLEKERDTQSKAFQKTSADTSENYKGIARSLGSIMRDIVTSTGASSAWERFTSKIREDIEKTELAMRNMNTPQMRAASERQRERVATPNERGPLTNQEKGLPNLENASPEALGRYQRRFRGRRPPVTDGGTPQRFSGGEEGGERGMAGMPWAVNPASDAKFDTSGLMTKGNIELGAKRIEFRDAEGNLINRDNAQKTEQNTAELKRLNDAIIYSQQPRPAAGNLAGQLGAGSIGGGGGGATRFPGGGSGPGIGSGGGTTSGGGATFGGGAGGGAAGGGGGGFNTGGTINPGQVIANTQGGGGGAPGDAVDTALKLEGLGERKDRDTIKQYLSGGGAGLDPATTAWCAAFVNSSLQRHGIKGTGSAVATSFLKWGQGVAPGQVQKGDVLVQGRGLAPGQTGGHVGLATGQTRMVNGQMQYEMLAGNQSDAVRRTWQAASGITARRAIGDFGGGAGGGVAGGVQGMPGTQSGQAPGLRAGPAGGQETYQKMLNAFSGSSLIGKVPPDGARFGIRTGSAEEWARFGTAVAKAESNFNPRTANTSDPGGSFGVLQYAHGQVPGGNAYNVDASISAFVRDAQQSVGVGSLAHGLLGRRFSTIGRHPERTIRNLANYPGMVPGQGQMPPGAQLAQGQMPQGGIGQMQTGTMGGVPVYVTQMAPAAAQAFVDAQHKANATLASSAANATAAAIKAGATPEQAAAAGAAAATTAHGVAPKPPDMTGKPDPERQKQEQRAAEDARRETEDERRQAAITRYQRQADLAQIRKEERQMTPEQRAQARQARKEQAEEEKHTREGEKLQATSERRDQRAKARQDAADRRLQERAEGERDPAGRRRPLRRQTESQRTGQKPWSRMTPQERADTLRDQQIEADRVRKEEEERRAQEDAAAQKLKDSRKSLDELEQEAADKADPAAAIDRMTQESRDIEDEYERNKPARRTKGRDPTTGFSASGKALDASGKALDAASGDTVKVQADGTLKVDVRASKGTSVAAKGEGAFKKTTVERSTQMEPANSGPTDSPAQGFD